MSNLKSLWIGAVFFCSVLLSSDQVENVYTIPVSQGLEKWATFSIPEAELRVRRKGQWYEVKLEYPMPLQLSGEDGLWIEGKAFVTSLTGRIDLQGQFLNPSSCEIQHTYANCNLKYKLSMPVLSAGGEDTVIHYLRRTESDPFQLEMRLKVLREFVHGSKSDVLDGHEAGGAFTRLRIKFR